MLISDRFSGNNRLFVGNRLAELQRIPVGATITRAKAIVKPITSSGEEGVSSDTIDFTNGSMGKYGESKIRNDSPNGFEEVDFHRRVTLQRIFLTATNNTSLQVDVGAGTFVEINSVGAFKGPGDDPFILQNEDNLLPGLVVTKLRISQASLPIAQIQSVTVRNIARNVALSLGESAPFFLHVGDLTKVQSSIDFTDMLQASLANAPQENGYYRVPFNLKTEGLARVELKFDIEYVQQQSVMPQQLSSVKLPYSYNGASDSQHRQLMLSIPQGSRILAKQTSSKVEGRFAGSKIVQGSLDQPNPDAPSILVNSQTVQAQAFSLQNDNDTGELAVDSIDLLLTAISPVARVQLDLRADLDGRPASESLLVRQPELEITTDTSATPTWSNLPLTKPVKLHKQNGKRYWLLLQSVEGDCRWSLSEDRRDGAILSQQSRDGGLSWRDVVINELDGPTKAEFRLRQNTDTFRVPIEIKVGEGSAAKRLKLTKFEPLGRIDFNLDGADLSNVINQYLDEAEQPLPPEGEQLLNHEFQYELELPNFTLLGWEQIGPHLSPAGEPLESIRIGDGESASGISQTVPALPGIDYELSVLASIHFRDAKAELIWRGGDCAVVQVEELLLAAQPSEAASVSFAVNNTGPTNRLYRLRTTAPAGVNQVEVRLLVPDNGAAQVDRISLLASPQKIANSDLREYDHQTIPNWTIEPVDALTTGMLGVTHHSEGVEIANHSDLIQPIILSQTVTVTTGQIVSVGFNGRNLTGSTDDDTAPNPEMMLRLINQTSGHVAHEMHVVIEPDSSDQHSLNTVVPDGVDQAEVMIILPHGGQLAVQSLTLQLSDPQQVPIVFLAEAPGELTVSDMRVGYEPKPAPQHPLPETGLCTATAADRIAGEDGCSEDDTAYCEKCGKHTATTQLSSVALSATRAGLIGSCIECGTRLFRNGGSLTGRALRLPIRRVDHSSRRVAESNLPLTSVAYIGPARAALLQENGIRSLNNLAATAPDVLVRMLDVNEEMAVSFVDQARRLLTEER